MEKDKPGSSPQPVRKRGRKPASSRDPPLAPHIDTSHRHLTPAPHTGTSHRHLAPTPHISTLHRHLGALLESRCCAQYNSSTDVPPRHPGSPGLATRFSLDHPSLVLDLCVSWHWENPSLGPAATTHHHPVLAVTAYSGHAEPRAAASPPVPIPPRDRVPGTHHWHQAPLAPHGHEVRRIPPIP